MWSANAYCFSDENGQFGTLANKLGACRLRVKLITNGLANYKHRRRAQMAAKFVSCYMGRAHRLSFFAGCAAGVLVALQTLALGAGSAATESLTGNNPGANNLATAASTASPAPEKGDQVNVKTYGAVGDGVTNDTAAFNAALDSLADAGGGVCLVPRGTYIISASGITSHVKSGVHLVGEGVGGSGRLEFGHLLLVLRVCVLVWSGDDERDRLSREVAAADQPLVSFEGRWFVKRLVLAESARWWRSVCPCARTRAPVPRARPTLLACSRL